MPLLLLGGGLCLILGLLLGADLAPALPAVGLLVLAALAIGFIDIRLYWVLAVACIPLSINLQDYFPSVSISLPSDLLSIALMLLVVYRYRAYTEPLGVILRHPLTLVFGLYIFWMWVCVVPSVRPVVSVKYALSATWFFLGTYVFTCLILRDARWLRSLWLVAGVPMAAVVLFTLTKHAADGFSLKASYEIMQPFYKEHTAYGASVAFFVPALALVGWTYAATSRWRYLAWGISVICLAGVLFSYTRGAWLGLLGAAGVLAFLYTWERFRVAIVIGIVSLALLAGALSQTTLYFKADADKQTKSFGDRLVSALNTKTDLSNRERFNRWMAALSMAEERPVFGFGPGTYAMEYAPYQQAQYRTIVSTNQGDIGSAHNEFLLAASELGWPGTACVAAWYLAILLTGMQGFFRSPHPGQRALYAGATAALATHILHALVNNFFDQDKVCMPVYWCMATIVALDVFHAQIRRVEK
jgi:O-antigen ligase